MIRLRTLTLAMVPISSLLLSSAGCAGGGSSEPDASRVDAPSVVVDARPLPDAPPPPPDAMPDAMPDAAPPDPFHLLLTEVALADANREFIEIYNPGSQTVALRNYYLSDDAEYWLLPGAFSQLDANTQPRPQINPDFDFIAKFPDTATIGPGQVKTIAFRYTLFEAQYGMPPDFAFLEAPNQAVAMVDPSGNSGVVMVGATPQLTNGGEAVVLFYWDGASDLVKDVDMLNAGNMVTAANRLESKDGRLADGPDPDTNLSAYARETASASIPEIDAAANTGFSHKRILREAGHEIQAGTGNGILGDDELSEDVTMTWDNGATFSAPTPGAVPDSLRN